MAGTTTRGYPYPDGTDKIKDLPAKVQALAQAVDEQIGRVYRGKGTVSSMPAAGTAKTVTVTLGVILPGLPTVVASVRGSTNRNADVKVINETTSSFDIVATNRTDTTDVFYAWIATY